MLRSLILTALVALLAGFAGAAAWQFSGLGDERTRTYLIDNPDILPAMADAYQQQLARERLGELDHDVAQAFPGAILGNPNGSKTLVEFTDYGCTYCRASVPHVQQLIAADPELKVVIREWPIFDGSESAARMALAAAKQGKFAAFHDAMFAHGPPSDAAIAAAARSAGLDMAAAEAVLNSPEVDAEIARNRSIAQQLGFSGTPSWIAGGRILEGMVGPDALAEAIEAIEADGSDGG